MSQSRQLAAIMFTDIVGYTALMGSDEQNAFQLLKKNRQIQQPLIKQYNGTWIKEIGDAVLASFRTVTDAVLCAAAIHKACDAIEGLKLRIGIHLGEVVFEDNDVFGDGVNIASRLQALAPVGGTWISESVYKNVVNKKEITTEFVKEETLKNVSEPVKIYEIKVVDTAIHVPDIFSAGQKSIHSVNRNSKKKILGLSVLAGFVLLVLLYFFVFQKKETTSISSNAPEKSIAVLPFVNMSDDKEQEYFSDGLSEELLNQLANIPDLKVISRTSSFSFKGKNEDIRKIGEKLGVANILEGSVRKSGNTIRITAQLVEVNSGAHRWSATYDREIEDIFKIQDEISTAVVQQLKAKLLTGDKSKSTENSEAYSLYLKGRYEWNKRTKEGFLKSIDYFNQAIEKDPQYSLAYAGIADSYTLLCGYHFLSPEASLVKAKEAVDKAMQLNPQLPEAFEAAGHIEFLSGFNWEYAEDMYRKAINLNPNFATAHQRLALLLTNKDRFNEALEKVLKAQELDPLSLIINTDVALQQLIGGDADKAINKCNSILEVDSNFAVTLFIQGLAFERKGDFVSAINNFNRFVDLFKNNPIAKSALAHAMALNGDKAGAMKILKELENISGQEFVSPYCLAVIHAGLGQTDEVFRQLDKTIDQRSVWIIHMHFSTDPRFNELRNDPRFRKLLEKVQLVKQ